MKLNFYTLSVIYLVYSFLGWVGETVVATAKGRRFTNRGVASGPFCFVYGTAGVLLAVGLADLRNNWFALFAGSFLIATVVEWVTAKLLERVHHRRWWDYSDKKFNLDGYVCLQYSALWGVLGAAAVRWGTDRLQQKIAARVERRIQRAYPAAARPEPTTSAEKAMSVSDLVWLFVVGAFLGDVVETLFCRITAGVWMSRSSLVWGPFSVVWGLALVLAAVLLRGSEHQSESRIFWFGVILGGAYEYVCSAVTELLFGTVFWDYSGFKFNLGGRINLLYCFFWGIAAVTWMRYGYPLVAKCMGKLKSRIRPWMTAALAVFMAVNMLVSALALARYDARTSGVEAANPVDVVLDAHFDNARMERIYPNAKKVSSHAR